jgi:hypothetical protein
MADDEIPVTVSLTGEHTIVLRFRHHEFQQHLADARSGGQSVEDYLARRLAAAVVVESLIVLGLAQDGKAGGGRDPYNGQAPSIAS